MATLHRNCVRLPGSVFARSGASGEISGTTSSRGWTCTIDGNPVGFCLIISMKAGFVGVAIAEILYAFGLVGDPFAHTKHALPFLA
jgi:hypothetical protein